MKVKLSVATFWVCPVGEAVLPEASHLLRQLLVKFYRVFPEYDGALRFLQSQIGGRQVFVYTIADCPNLLPDASEYLRGLLEVAFSDGEIKSYGRLWREGMGSGD